MKKITILALHLGYGGIERAISMVANSLVDTYDVTIVSTYQLYDTPRFPLKDQINVEYLLPNGKPNREEFVSKLKQFRLISCFKEGVKAIKILKQKKQKMTQYIKHCDSDVIISTRDIHNKWLGKYGKENQLKIGWEHNHHNDNKKYIRKIVKSVQNLNYFILVSKELTTFYQEKLRNTSCKCIYIPNGIDTLPEKLSSLEQQNIITIGRLSKEKGYLDLIDVYKLIAPTFPDWRLHIIGDGVEKVKIEKKIKEYGLEDSIILHGYQSKEYINQLLDQASIYVMSSFTESFGIVLLEAFAYGIPAVSFTSAQGANEIITDNWDGYLVKDRSKEQMAKKICELMASYNRRFVMGHNASKKVREFYIDKIKEDWIHLIEKG